MNGGICILLSSLMSIRQEYMVQVHQQGNFLNILYMSEFTFLYQYIFPSEKEVNNSAFSNYKHNFFPLNPNIINEIDKIIKIPLELKKFYNEVGYGFFFCEEKIAHDRLLDVNSFKIINLREDYYEFDPDLEIYQEPFYKIN